MNNKRVINSNTTFLKIIAIISMTLDHIGIIFFPNIIFFRIIGRMSFPLFAYCTASGCIFTKNIKKYILRLFVLGFISQPILLMATLDGNTKTLLPVSELPCILSLIQ